MFVTWRVPGLDLDARTCWYGLGSLPLPDDIAIVAIDEASLARFGRYPWRRSLTAQMLDQLTGAHSKAIALDVLFSEPTNNADDSALVPRLQERKRRHCCPTLTHGNPAGRLASAFTPLSKDCRGGRACPRFDRVDGARPFLVRQADDQGQAEWAMALEIIRVGEGVNDQSIQELPGAVSIGGNISL